MTLIWFLVAALLLSLVLALIVLSPWLLDQRNIARASTPQHDQLLSLNIDVFRARLAELDDDHANGRLDDATYTSQKRLLERQLLDISGEPSTAAAFVPNWKSYAIFLVWLPFLSAAAYLMIGSRSPVYDLWQAQDRYGNIADELLTGRTDTPPAEAARDPQALLSAIQTNVYRHAADPMRWYHLSEVYLAVQAPEQAITALQRAYRLSPDDERIALAYAQTRFFGQGGTLDDEARQVVARILQRDPQHEGAQMLMLMGDMQAGDYDNARRWLTNIRQQIQNRSGDHTQALNSLSQLAQTIDERAAQADTQATAAQTAVTINVQIAPDLVNQIAPNDSLFVLVRPAAGGAPVAVKKLAAAQLAQTQGKANLTITLSDNDSPMPTAKLSQVLAAGEALTVLARVSHSGNAMPQTGDLASNAIELPPNQAKSNAAVDVMVNHLVP